MTALELGGPGAACSAMTVRRLAAGELPPEAAARATAHLAGCARCQAAAARQAEERRALEVELPYERFAAGVAERLAAGAVRPTAAARPAWRRLLPLALAASVALGVALPLTWRLDRQGGEGDGTRLKGGAAATLHLAEAGGSRALRAGESIPTGGALRLSLAPAGRRFVAVAVLDEDGPALLQAGPAALGPGPAFEWTGRRGVLLVVLDDAPVDGAALLSRLASGGAAAAAPSGAAEVLRLPLARGGP